jgi:hypothetical protein
MELKNYDELIPQIARMMLDHDKAHTGYQEDIYLYVDADGNGSVELFQNVGGNSWLDDDHYTACHLPECYTDWTDTYQEICCIADALGWTAETLRERTAAWCSETTGDYMAAEDVEFSDVREFIEDHQPLLDMIYEDESRYFEDSFSDYVDSATELLDAFLLEIDE